MTEIPDPSPRPAAPPPGPAPGRASAQQPGPAASPGAPRTPTPPLSGTSVWATTALGVDAVVTAGTALLLTSLASFATNTAGAPPLAFYLVMAAMIGWMLLRTLALALVRWGLAWARWLYLAVVLIGAAGLFALMPQLPITGILLAVSVPPLIAVFLPSTGRWLQGKALRRRRRRGLL